MFLLAMLNVGVAAAQIDNLLEGAWAAPALDILERYKQEPLCLRCAPAHQLTEIPGVSQRTAHAIARLMKGGSPLTIAGLCDTLCLGPDLFLLLSMCATTECGCNNMFKAAACRARISNATASTTTGAARVDVTYRYGRAGIVGAATETVQSLAGAWATATLGGIHVACGDIAIRVGGGLLVGTARGLSRGAADVFYMPTDGIAMRPWTSSNNEGAFRGVMAYSTPKLSPVQTHLGYGTITLNGKPHTMMLFGVQTTALNHRVSATIARGNAIVPDVPLVASVTISRGSRASSYSLDALIDGYGRTSVLAAAETSIGNTDFAGSAWYYHPTMASTVGTAIGTSSAPVNSYGFIVGTRHRIRGTASGGLTIVWRERVTRSYLTPLPSRLFDAVADADVRIGQRTTVSCRIRSTWTTESASDIGGRLMTERWGYGLRGELERTFSRLLTLRVRIDARTNGPTSGGIKDHGVLGAVSAVFRASSAFDLRAQWVRFVSTSFDAAPYIVSPSAPGAAFPWPATGDGVRRTLVCTWRPAPHLGITASGNLDTRNTDGARATTFSVLLQADALISF